jgi:hypothetical protein
MKNNTYLYSLNPTAFQSMLYNLDQFLETFEEIQLTENIACTPYLEIADQFRQNVLDNLKSIELSILPNKIVQEKYNTTVKQLTDMLQTYIQVLAAKCNKPFIDTRLISNTSQEFNSGPIKAYNYDVPDYGTWNSPLGVPRAITV